MPKFKSNSGGHVAVHYGMSSDQTVELLAGEEYETDDKREIEALKGSPEVVQVGASKKGESPSEKASKSTDKQRKETKPAREDHAERVAAAPPAGADKDAPKVQ